MNQRVSALVLACITTFSSGLLQAQGLRPSGSSGLGAGRAPSLTLPPSAQPASNAQQQQADYIVAVVNSEPITNNEVRQRLARAEQQLSQQGIPMPPRAEMVRQVLESMVAEKAMLQQARESGIKVDDALIDQTQATLARQNGVTVEELQQRITADGLSLERFRADLRNQLLLRRLRERDVEGRVQVSDLDIDQYIREQQTSTGQSGMEINLGHILLRVPENATPEEVASVQARAQSVADRAHKGDDFSMLAREFSSASEAASGGTLGLRPVERYPTLFVESTQRLPVGGIAGPVRSPAGFHILKVIERERPTAPGALVTQSHARHILLRPGPNLSETAAVARLAEYKTRVLSGRADFADLAREHSQDGSASQGGDLGWTNPGQFVPEFEEVLDTLSPGQISDPLISRFGVHLIELLERRTAKLSQREQREIARNAVHEKKLDEAYANWAREIRGRAYVEMREAPQ